MFFRFTVFYRAKIGLDIIRKYVEGMKEKDVLRLAAEKCGIGLKTSFFWRHKILDSLRGGLSDEKTCVPCGRFLRISGVCPCFFEGVFPLFQNKIYIHARCQQP